MEWVDLSWCNLYKRGLSQSLFRFQIIEFLRLTFQLQNYFLAQHFRNLFSSKFFTLTFHCFMPFRPPVENNRRPDEQVEDVTVSQIGPGNLWEWASNAALRPKSALISIPLFRLPKLNSWSSCPRLSMEALAWLSCTMIMLLNHTLPIAIYFDPKFFADNEKCPILLRLVYAYLSIADMDICL